MECEGRVWRVVWRVVNECRGRRVGWGESVEGGVEGGKRVWREEWRAGRDAGATEALCPGNSEIWSYNYF